MLKIKGMVKIVDIHRQKSEVALLLSDQLNQIPAIESFYVVMQG